jgi:TonB-linked SusC/RagA family outer membrane protein
VVDENNNPLSGVTVQVKNTRVTTTTDANGNYTIEVPDDNRVLIFSYVGFESQELVGRANLVIQMKASGKALDDVIVVGYGTQKRASVTGSVDVVKSTALAGRPVSGMADALQGTSPNLIIQQRAFQPGTGALNINIRGLGTTNNNDPLVVIDGIIGGDLSLVNPADIDNISILKDAGSTAIYGSRAANGVILISTKKGKKNQKPTMSYNGIYGVQTPRITFHQVHAWENATFKNISLANSGKAPAFTDAQIADLKARGDGDWKLENILHNAQQQSHNLSVSGGGPNSAFLMSAGYFDQRNMLVGPGFGARRYNFRLNQSTTVGKLNITGILSYAKNTVTEPSSGAEGLIGDVTRAALYGNFQDAQGHWLSNDVTGTNPKAILMQGGNHKINNDEVTGNLRAEYSFSPAFKIRGIFGGIVKANTQNQRQIYLQFPAGSYANNRQVYDYNTKGLLTNTQLVAEFNKTFNAKHDLNIILGVSNESTKYEGNGVRKTNTDSTLGIPTTGTTVDAGTTDGSYNSLTNTQETSLNSALGRIQYGYDNRYYVDFNFRYDGSSNFPSDQRWGFFPAVGLKWRVSEESFLKNYRAKVGDLSFRASFGTSGNQSVNPYQYITTYSTNNNTYGFNNTAVSGATRNLANPSLTWEKAKGFNVGVDQSLFDHKLNVTIEYFSKTTDDILQGREDVTALFGAGLPTYNISKVRNQGWEAKIDYQIKGAQVTHSFSFNIADNQNKLLDLANSVKEYIFKREEFWFVRRVGLPITVYQGYQTNGLYQTTQELSSYPKFGTTNPGLGDVKFVDQNHDGVIDIKDRVILGNPFPRFTFGFTYNVAYKGFDASVFIQGVGKRDQLVRGELLEAYHYGYSGTMYEHQKDFWTPTNTGAKYPRIAENGSDANSIDYKIGSDIYKFNAAYARLKNLQIGYSLPQQLVSRLHIQKARFYFTAQNLITVSKLKIIDPESSEFNNRVDINSGANSARSYPTPKFFGGGLDITF